MTVQKISPILFCFFVPFFLSACNSQESWLMKSLQNGANNSRSFSAVNAGGATGEETWQDGGSAKCKENFIEGSCF